MKGIRFRPEQDGLRAALFDLEAEIMEVVWTKGWAEFSVGDVQRELERTRDIAYTTVMTTLGRLYKKEILKRVRDGRRYVYQPAMSREAFTETMVRDLLGSLSELGHEQAMSLLVEQVAESDADELQRLEALIRRRRKGLKK